MSIRVTCPNGHELRVKESMAGKTGLCPACKAKVIVPQPAAVMSEEDIINVLGPHDPTQEPHSSSSSLGLSGSGTALGERSSPPKKSCSSCNREIASGTHICPFCRTYIANLSDL